MKKLYTQLSAAIVLLFLNTALLNAQDRTPQATGSGVAEKPAAEPVKFDNSEPALQNLYRPGCVFEGFTPEQEILEKRGYNTKTFKRAEGEYTGFLAAGITHYWEKGGWRTATNEIVRTSDARYPLANVNNASKVYYGVSGTGIRVQGPESDGTSLEGFTPSFIGVYDKRKNLIGQISSVQSGVSPKLNNEEATAVQYDEIYPSVAYQVDQKTAKIKTQYVVARDMFSSLNARASYIGFVEELELPAGAKAQYDKDGKDKRGVIVYQGKTPIFKYSNARYWSSKKGGERGTSTLEFTQRGNHLQVVIMVPLEWLTDPSTQYPVTVDPAADFYSWDFNVYGPNSPYYVPNAYWGSGTPAYGSTGSSNSQNEFANNNMVVGWKDDPYSNDQGGIGGIISSIVEFFFAIIDFVVEIFNDNLVFNDFFTDEAWLYGYIKFALPQANNTGSMGNSQGGLPDDFIPVGACADNSTVELKIYQETHVDGGGNRECDWGLFAGDFDPQSRVYNSQWSGLKSDLQTAYNGGNNTILNRQYQVFNTGSLINYSNVDGQKTLDVTDVNFKNYIISRATNASTTDNFFSISMWTFGRGRDESDDETEILVFRGYESGATGPYLKLNYTYTPGGLVTNATALNNGTSLTCGFDQTVAPINLFTSNCVGDEVGDHPNDDAFYRFSIPSANNATVNFSTCDITGSYSSHTSLLLFDNAYSTTTPIIWIKDGVTNTNVNSSAYMVVGSLSNNSCSGQSAFSATLLAGHSYYLAVETPGSYSVQPITLNISIPIPGIDKENIDFILWDGALNAISNIQHPHEVVWLDNAGSHTDNVIDFCGDKYGNSDVGYLTMPNTAGTKRWYRATTANANANSWGSQWGTGTNSPHITRSTFPENDGTNAEYTRIKLEVSSSPSCPTFQQIFEVKNRYNEGQDANVPITLDLVRSDYTTVVTSPADACPGTLYLRATFPNNNSSTNKINLNGRVEFVEESTYCDWDSSNTVVVAQLAANADADGVYDNKVIVQAPTALYGAYKARFNGGYDVYDLYSNSGSGVYAHQAPGCPYSGTSNDKAPLIYCSNTVIINQLSPPTNPAFALPAGVQCYDGSNTQTISISSPPSVTNTGGTGCALLYYWQTPGNAAPTGSNPSGSFGTYNTPVTITQAGDYTLWVKNTCTVPPASCEGPTVWFAYKTWNIASKASDPVLSTATPATGSTVCLGTSLTATATYGTNQGSGCSMMYRYSKDNGGTWLPSTAGTPAVPTFTAAVGTNLMQAKVANCVSTSCESNWATIASWTGIADPDANFTTFPSLSPSAGTVCEGTQLTLTGSAPSGGNAGLGCQIEYRYSLDDGNSWITWPTLNSFPTFVATYPAGGGNNIIQARRTNCTAGCDAPTAWTEVANWAVDISIVGPMTIVQDPDRPVACDGETLTLNTFEDPNDPSTNCSSYDLQYVVTNSSGSTTTPIATATNAAGINSALSSFSLTGNAGDTITIQARRVSCTTGCGFSAQPFQDLTSWTVNDVPLGAVITNPIPVPSDLCVSYIDTIPLKSGYCYGDDVDLTGYQLDDAFLEFTVPAGGANIEISTWGSEIFDPTFSNYYQFADIYLYDNTNTLIADPWGSVNTDIDGDGWPDNNYDVTIGTLDSFGAVLPAGTYRVMIDAGMYDLNSTACPSSPLGGPCNVGFDAVVKIGFPRPYQTTLSGPQTVCYNSSNTYVYSLNGGLNAGSSFVWDVGSMSISSTAPDNSYVVVTTGTAVSGDSVKVTETYGTCTVNHALSINTVVADPPIVTALSDYCLNDADSFRTTPAAGEDIWYSTVGATPVGSPATNNYKYDTLSPPAVPTSVAANVSYTFKAFGTDGTNTCLNGAVTPVNVTVHPLPTALSHTVGTGCGTDSVFITAGAGDAVYVQLSAEGTDQSNLLPTFGAYRLFTVSPNAQTKYYFRAKNANDCWGDADSVTLDPPNALPVTPGVSGTLEICSGGSTTITASNGGDGTMWYFGTNPALPGSPTQTSSATVSALGTYYFRAVDNTTGCWSNAGSGTVTTAPTPPAPMITTLPNTTVCAGTSILMEALPQSGEDIYWLGTSSTVGGASPILTNVQSFTPSSSATFYFVSKSAAGCWGNPEPTAITVNTAPGAPVLNVSSTPACSGTSTIDITAVSGVTYYYTGSYSGEFPAPNGNVVATGSGNGYSLTTPGVNTYYFQGVSNGCNSAESFISVTTVETPTVPVVTTSPVPGQTDPSCGSVQLSATTTPASAVVYYAGLTSTISDEIGTETYSLPVTTSTSGHHYFRAENGGCTSALNQTPNGDVTLTPLPPAPTVTGNPVTVTNGSSTGNAGVYCGSVQLASTAAAGGGTIYWQNTNSLGTTTTNAITTINRSASGTYYYREKSGTCWSNAGSATVTVSPAVQITPSLDGCLMPSSPLDLEHVVVSAVGGTGTFTIAESSVNLTPVSVINSASRLYQVPIPSSSGSYPVYNFRATDDNTACYKETGNWQPYGSNDAYIQTIPEIGSAPASQVTLQTRCYAKGTSGWLYFRTPGTYNEVMGAIDPNGNDLGEVVLVSYVEPTEPTIGNHNPSATTCASEPMKALRRHFVVVTTNPVPANANVKVRLFFSQTEVDDLITATAGATPGSCDEVDKITSINDLHVIKYHASTGNEALEDGDYANNSGDASPTYTLFGPNALPANTRNIDKDNGGSPTTFTALFNAQTIPGSDRHWTDLAVTDFSEFWLGGSADDPVLPVELLFLTAEPVNNQYIKLKWATATEIDNDGFWVERSVDGTNWTQLGWVNGHDNSVVRNDYSFDDMNVQPDVRYYYRLKQMDNDQDFEYSNIVTAVLSGNVVFSVKDFLPNPAVDQTSLIITAVDNQEITVEIFNVLGEKVIAKTAQLHRGGNKIDFDFSLLASGTYTAIVSSANEIYTKKLVITR